MASPFSASTAEPAAADTAGADPREQPGKELLLVAGADDPAVVGFAAHAARTGGRDVVVLAPAGLTRQVREPAQVWRLEAVARARLPYRRHARRIAGVVLFLGRGRHRGDGQVLDALVQLAQATEVGTVCVVGSFLVHRGDRAAAEAEAAAVARLRQVVQRVVVFRVGHLIGRNTRLTHRLGAWSFLYPLVPSGWRTGFLDLEELATAVDQELRSDRPRRLATYTLLGTNRAWRTFLRAQPRRAWQTMAASVAHGLSWLGVGWLLSGAVAGAARFFSRWRGLDVGTLYPTSPRELLELYNKYSYPHVKVVGYNNGVVHFGQSFPGKTVIATVHCNQTARVRGKVGTFDAGVTLRQAIEAAGQAGKQFHVLPNYSYVSIGTAFFVPIHGSASEFSTLGDTIEGVLLYDPAADRFVSARRDEPTFNEYIYNLRRDCLLLRLRVRLKDQTLYYRKHTRLENPTGLELLALLQDARAANVEIRKGKAAGTVVDVYQYYTDPAGDGAALPLPRDSLGQLWDRLEANPVTSYLFHALTRRFAFHVEAFFTAAEFAVFWETHRTLPIAKIQLRYIRRDGLPHSPFRAHDCVSADLFMLRKHRARFDAYIKENFRAVQFNPGKHSA